MTNTQALTFQVNITNETIFMFNDRNKVSYYKVSLFINDKLVEDKHVFHDSDIKSQHRAFARLAKREIKRQKRAAQTTTFEVA